MLTCFFAEAEEKNNNYRLKILEYLSNNKEFSSSFIQYNDDAFQEGEFFLKKKQIKNRVQRANTNCLCYKRQQCYVL